MKKFLTLEQFAGKRTLLFGCTAMIFGLITFFNGLNFTKWALDLLALYFVLVGAGNLFFRLLGRRTGATVGLSILHLLLGLLLNWLNRNSNLPVNVLIISLGFYQICTGIVYLITFALYIQNRVRGGWRYLLDSLLYGGIGLASVLEPGSDGHLQFLLLGVYLCLLGYSNIREGLFFDREQEHKELRRRFRVSLPVIVAAFIPAEQLSRFNQFLKQADLDPHRGTYQREKNSSQTDELEVLVHTSDANLFGAIGHVDICYKGQVISYGSYDQSSERLFGTVGDGVLFKVEKEAYIELCKKESSKTLFGYSISLTPEEVVEVEKRLAEIDQLLTPWHPSADLVDGEYTYAYKLEHDLGASLYKFNSSRFKTYFILSTNCCLLADSIIGQAGTAVIDVRGIIAPGTYQDYLRYEFEAPNGLVRAQTIYQ